MHNIQIFVGTQFKINQNTYIVKSVIGNTVTAINEQTKAEQCWNKEDLYDNEAFAIMQLLA